eukprot:7389910-Prorocentrum_lima.AAC.1
MGGRYGSWMWSSPSEACLSLAHLGPAATQTWQATFHACLTSRCAHLLLLSAASSAWTSGPCHTATKD